MELRIDRKVYSDSCLSKVIYLLSDSFSIERMREDDFDLLKITPTSDKCFDSNGFWNQLNDFKLREIINKETKDIRTILYAKAFGDFDELTEDDFE